MKFTEEQQKQFDYQLTQHEHEDYEVDIELDEQEVLEKFAVDTKVLRPEIMSALPLAKWLYFNNAIYREKAVLDMGCGTGIQGVVCRVYGADKVVFSDIAAEAVENTKKNVAKYGLENSIVVHGDLFEKVEGKFDLIIFNHPFFSDQTMEEMKVQTSMTEQGSLIHRFFDEARDYMNEGARIIMPYYHLAGEINDPEVQAPKHDLKVEVRFRHDYKSGIQKGLVSIYEISEGKQGA